MKPLYFFLFLFICINCYSQNPCPGITTVDYAGKIYNTVQVGNQCWLKENLDLGTRINSNSVQLNNNIIEKYCYNDDTVNCHTYGALYEWAEAVQYLNGATNFKSPSPDFTGNVQGICPSGWHIPTIPEYQTMIDLVNNDGNALKAIGQGTSLGTGTNTSGFSAMLGGYSDAGGYFFKFGIATYFWSVSESGSAYGRYFSLDWDESATSINSDFKLNGFSVRCLNDNFTEVGYNFSNPNSFFLDQNYPNPFNPNTTIKYSIPSSDIVTLKVYDVLGKEVTSLVNGFKNTGNYEVNFDGSKLSSGTYFYQLKTAEFCETKKLILLK
ncbi:MAG: FISUMP domain-containing protein [bacterium]